MLVARAVFIKLTKAVLVGTHLLVEIPDLHVQLFNLVSQRLLHWVCVEETLNLLFTEQELFLDQVFHIKVAVNHCLKKLCEVGRLAALTIVIIHTDRLKLSVDAFFLWVNNFVLVTRGHIIEVLLVPIDPVFNLDDLLRAVDHIVVSARTWVDFQVGPDHGFLEQEAGQDLLHNLVLHVQDLRHNQTFVAVFTLVSELRHLLLECTRLNIPSLL